MEVHGDNQYNPSDILKAQELIKNEYDLIIGSRFVNKNPYLTDGMPLIRYITNKFTSKITSLITNIKLSEFHTGFKIFSRKFHETTSYEKIQSHIYLVFR